MIAPLWPVDDLAALLFVTRRFGSLRQLAIAEAVAWTADWLRTLSVAETQRELDALVTRLEATPEGIAVIQHACPRLGRKPRMARRSSRHGHTLLVAVDWAAFQVTRASM